MTLGDKIRKARLNKKWSMIYVVKTLRRKISPTYLTHIELHGEIPSPELLREICELLQLSYYKLVIDVKKEKTEQLKKILNKRYETK